MLAVQLAFLLHKPVFHQGGVAVGTGEFLRVPRQTHGNEEGASGGRRRRQELRLRFVAWLRLWILRARENILQDILQFMFEDLIILVKRGF